MCNIVELHLSLALQTWMTNLSRRVTESSSEGPWSRSTPPCDPLLDVSSLLYNVFMLMLAWRSPWPRTGRKQWAVPISPAQFAFHFINKKGKKNREKPAPLHGGALPKLSRLQRGALPTNFLQCDDRIESLSISGVPPLAPGRCCHYACLQSWRLNTLAGSEGEDWRRQREKGGRNCERENVSAPLLCFELSENACAIIAVLCLPQQEANTESQRRGAEMPDTVKWAKYIH